MRLCGTTSVARLFEVGESGFAHPFKSLCSIVAGEGESVQVKFLISVPKRNHKRANKRNLLKRRIREALRLNKHIVTENPAFEGKTITLALIYVAKDVVEYKTIENGVKKVLSSVELRG